MNSLAQVEHASRAPSRVEVYMAKVLPAEDRAAIKAALPVHVNFDRFERNLANALMNEPKLLECNPREVFREVAKIAALGLVIDAQLGEAYLIVGFGKDGPRPQIRVGYRGLIKLARQSGDVAGIYAHEVCENDHIEAELGTEKRLVHRPDLFGERGRILGYYAVIKYKDGDSDFEPMNPAQINAIRDKSDGYRAFKAGKIKDTPWNSGYDEMAKKTCIRRLMKRSPMSPDLARAIRIEDEAEFPSERLAARAEPSRLTPPDPGTPPRPPEPTAPDVDWDAELHGYDGALAACEAVEALDEAVAAFRDALGDAPEVIRAEAAKAETMHRERIARQEDPAHVAA